MQATVTRPIFVTPMQHPYHFRPRTFELALQQQQQQREQPLPKMRHVTFQGAPTLEEVDDGFQEGGKRKRPRGRPPSFVVA
jgi:hypothetical protein